MIGGALQWVEMFRTPIGVTWVHEAYPWIQIHRTEPTHKGGKPRLVVVYRHPRIRVSKERPVRSWEEALQVADEFRLVEARADLEQTRPVVDRPDSVTHWTCPATDGQTHHLVNDRCRYCERPAGLLRSEQLAIIESGALQ